MNVLSLFAGIGGLELGLERAGMTVVGQVELDPLCREVLATHWPEVPKHDDVRTAVEWWLSESRPPVHVAAGGFPCQPFARAGRRRGTADERWGWPWMFDVIRAVRPQYVVVENVADLLRDRDAFGWLLGDLASIGFDAEWGVLSACAVGAPHVRERLFLVAYPHRCDGRPRLAGRIEDAILPRDGRTGPWGHPIDRAMEAAARPDRVADGLARRMVAAGGNAVVPQVAEHVGRLIVAAGRAGVAA